MSVAFPLSPVPSYYVQCSFPSRNGVFYVGDTPSISLSQATPNAYYVLDYYGNQVSSGSVSGTTVTPTAPGGGWKPGWYRIYFTGTQTDSLFGPSYGATCFCVIRTNAHFPTMPAVATNGGNDNGATIDLVMKGVLGIGTSRISWQTASDPTTQLAQVQSNIAIAKAWWTNNGHLDTARPRDLLLAFPNGTTDEIAISSSQKYLGICGQDGTHDPGLTYVSIGAGTNANTVKITVFYPDTSTVVETFDNLTNSGGNSFGTVNQIASTISNTSAYIHTLSGGPWSDGFFWDGTPHGPTVIGNAYFNGVKSIVAALYPDVSTFEGPSNEPRVDVNGHPADTAQEMKMFTAAVHAGNASAKAIGPTPVSLTDFSDGAYFGAGFGAFSDGISFHDYNSQTDGDLNLGRTSLGNFAALLASDGLSSKPLWQTEAGQALNSVYGVYHPRRARVLVLHQLLWEQYGLPREHNPVWYDVSHGFWSFPAWLENGDTSLNPQCALLRVLAEETFGQSHQAVIDFGTIGNKIFVGSIYQAADTSATAVLMAGSYIPGSSVTLTVTGTSAPLTLSDPFGNTSTVNIVAGRATVPVSENPSYLRLPIGVTISVYQCNDWVPVDFNGNLALAATASLAGTPNSLLNDNGWMTQYVGGTSNPGNAYSSASLPNDAKLLFNTTQRIDRVTVWTGQPWQQMSSPIDFDVQTTVDGTNWTVQATVTNASCTSFAFGTSASNVGCAVETYWDEQSIFDIRLPSPVECTGVRLYVRATSYGGEPDVASITAGGQGDGSQHLVIQEMAVFCDANSKPAYVLVGP